MANKNNGGETVSNTRKLLGLFRLTPSKNNKKQLVPAQTRHQGKYDIDIKPIDLPDNLKDVYQYIVENWNTNNYRSNQFRFQRYKELRYMFSVSPIVNLAGKIYNSEIYSPQEKDKPIGIMAKEKKIEKVFYDWLISVGVDEQFIRSANNNLLEYGDSFWVKSIDDSGKNGITKMTIIDPFSVKNRLEYCPSICNYEQSWNKNVLNIANNYKAIKDIYDTVINTKDNKNKINLNGLFDSYCLGYELIIGSDYDNGDTIGVPPWMVTHCRMYTTENDFFPFGKPPLLGCLPPFKSLMTAMQLQDMLRCAVFPKEKITIKGAEGGDPLTRGKRVDEARRYMQKITPKSKGENNLGGVGQKIFAIEDLYDVELIDNSIDLDQIADIEMKEKQLVMATGVPDSYMLPSEGAGELGGDHAESLKYLSKIFQKRCDDIKESFLKGLSDDFRMHLMLTNQFDGLDTEFELSMPINSDDETSDHLDKLNDMMDFTKDLFSNLSDIATDVAGSEIPSTMACELMKKYLPDMPGITKWVNAIMKAKSDEEEKKQEEERMRIEMEKLKAENETLKQVKLQNPQQVEQDEEKEESEDEKDKTTRDTKSKERDAKRKEQQKNVEDEKKERESKTESVIRTFKECMNKNPNLMNEMYMKTRKESGIITGRFGNRFYFNDSYKHNNFKGTSLDILEKQIQYNQYDSTKENLQD